MSYVKSISPYNIIITIYENVWIRNLVDHKMNQPKKQCQCIYMVNPLFIGLYV